MSGWDQRYDLGEEQPNKRRDHTIACVMFAVGAAITFVVGLARLDALALGISIFLAVMAVIQWKLR